MYVNDEPPKMLPLRPIIRGPYSDNGDDDEHSTDTTIVYAEQHTEVKLNCEVDLDIAAVVWMHNGQVSGNFRFIVCFFTFTWIRPPPPEHEIWYIFLTRQVAQIQANRVHQLFLFCLHKKKREFNLFDTFHKTIVSQYTNGKQYDTETRLGERPLDVISYLDVMCLIFCWPSVSKPPRFIVA